jgi:hypothetical protein
LKPPVDKKKPIVSIIDDTKATAARPRQSVFPRSLESLKRPGVNITDFNSTVDNDGE